MPHRTLVVFVLSAVILVASGALARQPVLIVTANDYPPYTHSVRQSEPNGVYPAILRAIIERLDGYAVTMISVPWSRALRMVEVGWALAVFPPYRSAGPTRPYIDRYSRPLWSERVVLMCTRSADTAGRTAWPGDFQGFLIGSNAGYRTPGEAFFNAVSAGRLQLEEARDASGNLRKLLAGRIDCYVNSVLSIQAGLAEIGAGPTQRAQLKQVLTIGESSVHLGYTAVDAAFPYKDDFADRVDTILTNLHASGEIFRIVAATLGK